IWLRDSYILLQTKTDKGIINKDQLDTIMNFTRNFGTCNIEAAISACEKALNGIRRNFDLYLIILTLFISLRKIFIEKMV
ncbi:MAG: polymerase subunit delta, partial [Bacteroidota bacterium]|nr:polymerase subunit delta [Bacteroidota bacterium]